MGPMVSPFQSAAMAALRGGLPNMPPVSMAGLSPSDLLQAMTAGRLLPTPASTVTSLSTRTPSVSPPQKSPSSFGKKFSPPLLGAGGKLNPSANPPEGDSQDASGPKSILGSLEKMVQNNFGGKKKQPGPETNLSILQRLGIDEGVDYSKPLIDPMVLGSMFRPPTTSAGASPGAMQPLAGLMAQPQSHSTSTRSNSSECSSPDRFKAETRPASIRSEASMAKSPPPEDTQALPASSLLSSIRATSQQATPSDVKNESDEKVKDEEPIKKEVDVDESEKQNGDEDNSLRKFRKATKGEGQEEPRSRSASPPASDHAMAPAILGDVDPAASKKVPEPAANSPSPIAPLDGGTECPETPEEQPRKNGDHKEPGEEENHDNNSDHEMKKEDIDVEDKVVEKKTKGGNPLAALQMLCDKTEKPQGQKANTASNNYSSGTG